MFTVTATVIIGFISSLSIINITDKPIVIVMETRMPYSNANCQHTVLKKPELGNDRLMTPT